MQAFRKCSALLGCLVLLAAMVLPAGASTVVFNGKNDIEMSPGTRYHETDLFLNFKNIMPGDSLEQLVTIKNKISASSYITVYLKAVPHGANNPLEYSESYEDTDGKDQQHVPGQRDETVESMEDFLSQLTLTVKKGTQVIYSGHPNDPGTLEKGVKLGKINRGRSLDLSVTLDVPIEMGNEYALRVGEVDWVFYADIVEGKNLLQTGQLSWPIPVLAILGMGLIALGTATTRRKKHG